MFRKYCDLKDFEKKHHMKESGSGLGGDFNGPTIKNLLKEKTLNDLTEYLPKKLLPFVNYLKIIKQVHLVHC